ncbi:MAG TPA: ribose-5-phosphate isomerase RpiA [Thermoanaerobaculia bacterium]|jgi:ribose 5-phosphate isomerase A|nr:ribose-5-phosphate isomerase RpiA [Thermoanaerobaculia bacterium]
MNFKLEAAREAMKDVRSGQRLGLGTGSTAEEFVKLLGEALRSGTLSDIRCTCTSRRTEELARSLEIPIFTLAELAPLDLAIDGADEIDEQLRLIKGRGGALLREKIVEQAAQRFIVIADESKVVDRLGLGVLPVEVTPFAREVLLQRLHALQPVERASFVTDEGNIILDMRVPDGLDIADMVARLREHAGVVDTGFFPFEATEAVIAGPRGVRHMWRPLSS